MKISRKTLIFISFLLVDFFAAMETTAITVAAPRIGAFFDFGEQNLSWLVNSYLYSMFLALVALLFMHEKIRRNIKAKNFFIEGAAYFLLGSLICFFSSGIELFYFGRIIQGIGAAMAFTGQLWVMTESYREEIAKPLFFTQVGFASGIVIGPVLGGVASGFGDDGWKLIFLANSFVCVLIMLFIETCYKSSKQTVREEKSVKNIFSGLSRDFKIAILCEGIFSLAIVAIEFIFSIHFQNNLGHSSLATGSAILVASLGIVAGSGWVASRKHPDFAKILVQGFQAMIILIIIFGIIMEFSLLVLLLPVFFLTGLAIGYLSVAVYGFVAKVLTEDLFVAGSVAYLIAMQIGTAIGIEFENIWASSGKNFLLLSLVLTIFLQIALFFSLKLKSSASTHPA